MKKRVGILTAGGDCPGLNATIRGVAKALYVRMGDNVEIIGILNGYHGADQRGLQKDAARRFPRPAHFGRHHSWAPKRTPFKMMQVIEEDKIDKVAAMKKTYKDLKLDCLLCLGGNGTPQDRKSAVAGGPEHHRPAPRPLTTTSMAPM